MANLPLDPIFAHLLLKSHELGCVNEVVTAVSLLSADNVFLQVTPPPTRLSDYTYIPLACR